MNRNVLYNLIISAVNTVIDNWMKTNRTNETMLDIAQQLNLASRELGKWGSELEERYKRSL